MLDWTVEDYPTENIRQESEGAENHEGACPWANASQTKEADPRVVLAYLGRFNGLRSPRCDKGHICFEWAPENVGKGSPVQESRS